MEEAISILLSILPPFLLLGLGGLARALKLLRAEADASLSQITVRILYPAFILHQVLGSDDLVINHSFLGTALLGFLSIILGFSLAWIVSKVANMDRESAKSFCFCSGIFNYGYLAIPIGQALFGQEIVVHIILFNLGVEMAIWTVGILVLTSKKLALSGVINPPVVSIVLAFCLQPFGGSQLLPTFLWEFIIMVGPCAIPLGLILIGGSFYELMQGFRFSPHYKTEVASVGVRNLLFPVFVFSFLSFSIIPQEMIWVSRVLVVQAAMPAGIFAVVIVGNYAGDKKTAMRSILSTMMVGAITIPAWLLAGMKMTN